MCHALQIEFDPDFLSRIHSINVTGNSGRRPHKIIPLPRRPMTDGFKTEVRQSAAYREFASRFGYSFS